MKKSKHNKLDFTKNSVIELNDTQMLEIDGGTSVVCATAAATSVACVGILVVAIGVSYAIGKGEN